MSQIVFDCNTLQYTSNHNPIFTNPEGVRSEPDNSDTSKNSTVPSYSCPQDFEDDGLIMKKHSHQCIGATGSVLAPEATPTAKFIFAWCNPGVSLKPSRSCLSH